jgi:succinoglycan biosynthesis protein ExoV
VDPCWPVEQVLAAIGQTKVLLAEAMHGAIVADALGIPWIPIITSPRILTFKWRDWCSSLGLDYRPHYLMPSEQFYPSSARGLRSSLNYGKYWLTWLAQSPSYLFRPPSDWVARQLEGISRRGNPYLSTEARREELTVILEEKLAQLQSSHANIMLG